MKAAQSVGFKQKLDQEEQAVFNKIQARELEILNEEGQVMVLINSEQNPENKSYELMSFFNDDGEKVCVLEIASYGAGIFKIFNKYGCVSISSGFFGGHISLEYQCEHLSYQISIRPDFDGGSIKVCDDKDFKDNSISLKFDMRNGEVEIESEYKDESDDREIQTVKKIFKMAE